MSDTPSLQRRLQRSYDCAEWGKTLHGLFPDGSLKLFSSPQMLTASQESVKTTRQTGTIDLPDGNTIALLEVETSDQVKLARNRVGLRNFVASFIDEAGASAVLAVFHQTNSPDWRLTYAARRTVLDQETFVPTTVETAPRRFTFLLGENASCRTAASRLSLFLENPEDLNLGDVERAFSVETLSKEFFKKYKDHYQIFVSHLLAPERAEETRASLDIIAHDDAKKQEIADKPVRDFAKALLGRMVFLHFLQKKGWMGCEAGTKAWTGGDPEFLQSFFHLARSTGEAGLFHSHYLCPLFYEALNRPDRPGDLFPLTKSRLPYLNGGLFEEGKSGALRSLDFPPDLFSNLLDFFGEYNFTIDENDPDDHEVGIDPEMLSHIFENLLEDNKDKGAFYTPKAFVSYMCRQSLLYYLQAHLGKHMELETLLNEKDPTKHRGKNSFVNANRKKIIKLLDDLKICDPAIGSGAFPIGLLREILWTRLALEPELNTPASRAKLKRRIIQHSIHGIDIDPGAIEIARLRFWLALVVDEEIPRPLPNLDYKIMQGDGLLESFEGIDLSRLSSPGGGQNPFMVTYLDGTSELNLGKDGNASKLVSAQSPAKDIDEKMDRYFAETDPVMKRRLHQEIDTVVLDHLRHCVDENIAIALNLTDQQRKLIKGQLVRLRGWTKEKSESRIKSLEYEVNVLRETRKRLEDLTAGTTRPFFLWHLYFKKILETGGFDIFIANPPYVRADNHEALALRKKVEATGQFYTLWEKWDLYVAFIERGYQFLRQGGVLCYIVSDAYCHSKYAIKSQDWFLENSRVLRLDFLSDIKVFEAAVRNVLFFFQKADGSENIPDRRRHRENFGDCINLPSMPQKEATHRLFFLEDEGEKQENFEIESVPLEDLLYISKGMVAHANERVCQGAFKLEDLVANSKSTVHSKKFVEGKHLDRWLPVTHKWFEWNTDRSPALLSRPTFPEMYEVPEKLISVDMAAGGEHLRVAYDSSQLLHNHSAWSFVPWYSLMGVRNRSLKKQAKYRSEKPGPEDRLREDLENLSKQFQVKYLLAVMNSSVAREWLRARRRSNIHIYPDDWKPLPIPVVNQTLQTSLAKLVDQILDARKANSKADISDLETALDQKVKEAYGIG